MVKWFVVLVRPIFHVRRVMKRPSAETDMAQLGCADSTPVHEKAVTMLRTSDGQTTPWNRKIKHGNSQF